MNLYKYSGAGNLFVVLDGRGGGVERFREAAVITELCRRHATDGLMILDRSDSVDFKMEFYNPDGSGGMMCGNGGRCIAAFADLLGIRPAAGEELVFEAADGLHTARILSRDGERKTVRLKMVDVREFREVPEGYFLNTGTRHFVTFVPDVDAVDVAAEGPRHRWRPDFAPEGANANFVSVHPDGLHVRTFEKGVEGETLACGTGITASAIAAYFRGVPPSTPVSDRVSYAVRARQDWLSVDFVPGPAPHSGEGLVASDVFLTGPTLLLTDI